MLFRSGPIGGPQSDDTMGQERGTGPRERTMATRRIVVGVDGSIGAAAAVAWCAAMAPLLDADVVAVHAIETHDYAAPPSSSPISAFPDDA